MGNKFIFIGLLVLGSNVKAQQEVETQNYKHLHKSHQEYNSKKIQEFSNEEIFLNNQRNHKKSRRAYVVVPTDSLLERNVQGRKVKRNYKNQFN